MEENYIVQRRIKKEKLRREARRGEIAVRRIYKLIRFIFVLFIFYSAYRLCNAHYWYVPTDTFKSKNNKHVEIIGNSIVSNDKIFNELKKYQIPNKPIYKINPREIEERIEKLTPIKNAYVRRFWLPAKFLIMIEEVTPALIISPNEESPAVAAFALSGELITREYLPLNTKYPVVKILSYGGKRDDYDNWDKEKILNLYNIARAIKDYSNENVEYIDLRNPHNVFAQLDTVKIRIGDLDSKVYERIKSIHNILPEVRNIQGKIKYIDLAWTESKYIKLEAKNNEQ